MEKSPDGTGTAKGDCKAMVTIGNFMIFGDSYSTYKDRIPEGYPTFYTPDEVPPDQKVRNMTAEETWWGRLVQETDARLVRNDSWSGSTLGYTGYAGDCSLTSSFIRRYRLLKQEGFFERNPVDTVFVFGGTNDSWSNAPVGEVPVGDIGEEELFFVLPAFAHFMKTLKEDLPRARIVFLSNCDIKKEIMEGIAKAGEKTGTEVLQLEAIDKESGHPTALGMEQICKQLLAFLA